MGLGVGPFCLEDKIGPGQTVNAFFLKFSFSHRTLEVHASLIKNIRLLEILII